MSSAFDGLKYSRLSQALFSDRACLGRFSETRQSHQCLSPRDFRVASQLEGHGALIAPSTEIIVILFICNIRGNDVYEY